MGQAESWLPLGSSRPTAESAMEAVDGSTVGHCFTEMLPWLDYHSQHLTAFSSAKQQLSS